VVACAGRHVRGSAPLLLALVGLSLVLRSTALGAGYWIDEGLSVGIAHHDLLDIPGVLRQDGSPPLYYLLLHLWTALVGDGESATRTLSLMIALVTVAVAWAAGTALAGARGGWCAAALAATHPFLTYYAQETRMYALVVLLSLAAAALLAALVVDGRRGARVPLGVVLAALLLTHSWGLFLLAGMVVAVLGLAAARTPAVPAGLLLRDGGVVLGVVAVLYAAWIPTLIEQARHTGAPWSDTPGLAELGDVLVAAVGGSWPAIVLGIVAVAAAMTPPARAAGRDARLAWVLGAPAVIAVLLAFAASQVEPAWATRYVAVAVGPLILLAALALVRAGRAGLVGLAIVTAIGLASPQTDRLETKDGTRAVARELPALRPDDLVVAAHPERGPLVRYELGPLPHYADLLGPVTDPQVFDWRDALERLRVADPRPTADSLVRSVRIGARLVLLLPETRSGRWTAPWTRLVKARSAAWERLLRDDQRLRLTDEIPPRSAAPRPRGIRALVFTRTG